MRLIYSLPVILGIILVTGSLLLFRRERLDPRNFAIGIILSILVAVSPLIYIVLSIVKNLLGFTFTFVLGFGLAILFLVTLQVYLILSIGALRNETEAMWQEIALLRTEYENSTEDVEASTDD